MLDVQHRETPAARDPGATVVVVSVTGGELSREQIVDRIIQINRTATMAFLSRFSDASLRDYLRHLSVADVPRGAGSAWVRTGETPAIVGRESQD